MIICDLCGEPKDCAQREIEGKEYDICFDCWKPLEKKLAGKGRAKSRELVVLRPATIIQEKENKEPKPVPGEPPKIWGAMVQPN